MIQITDDEAVVLGSALIQFITTSKLQPESGRWLTKSHLSSLLHSLLYSFGILHVCMCLIVHVWIFCFSKIRSSCPLQLHGEKCGGKEIVFCSVKNVHSIVISLN